METENVINIAKVVAFYLQAYKSTRLRTKWKAWVPVA